MLLASAEKTHIAYRIILLVIDDNSTANAILGACGDRDAAGVKLRRACGDKTQFDACDCQYSQVSTDSEVYVLA